MTSQGNRRIFFIALLSVLAVHSISMLMWLNLLSIYQNVYFYESQYLPPLVLWTLSPTPHMIAALLPILSGFVEFLLPRMKQKNTLNALILSASLLFPPFYMFVNFRVLSFLVQTFGAMDCDWSSWKIFYLF
ncbi:MAG: hypothetical protein JXN60_09590 [Lentisphaerae bacterium]|nr:hypothetical protein [Lentisphaerota bacterium]